MILLHLKSYILCFLLLTEKPLVVLLKAFLFHQGVGIVTNLYKYKSFYNTNKELFLFFTWTMCPTFCLSN
jgi:hypothetical protein